jgi:S-methylmethionine-dependent homocysteine/selenocysteine methylase
MPMPKNHLTARLTRGEIVLLDGALGTELARRGVSTPLPLWSAQALLDAPDRVREIHEESIRAGADLVTAATFRTTPRALGKARIPDQADRLTALALQLAIEARSRAGSGRDVWIAGSMAPLEDCYRPDLMPEAETAEREHLDQALRLERVGAEILLVETMNSIAEAVAAARGARASALPVFVSFLCRGPGEIWNGERLADGVRALAPLRPDAILVNCVPPDMAASCLTTLAGATNLPIGCYPNAGAPDLDAGTWQFDPAWSPDRFAEASGEWVRVGAQVVGGCCGTTPEHVRALRAALPPVLVE